MYELEDALLFAGFLILHLLQYALRALVLELCVEDPPVVHILFGGFGYEGSASCGPILLDSCVCHKENFVLFPELTINHLEVKSRALSLGQPLSRSFKYTSAYYTSCGFLASRMCLSDSCLIK